MSSIRVRACWPERSDTLIMRSECAPICQCLKWRSPASVDDTVILNGLGMNWKEIVKLWFHRCRQKPGRGRCRSAVRPKRLNKILISIFKIQSKIPGDDGLFDEHFIEERRKGLESFINKIAGHPLAQNERCLHMFLQEPIIDKNYVPGKIRNT